MSDISTDGDPWRMLRQFTAARIALGHTGISQPTGAQLDFQMDHARARDAVHAALDSARLAEDLAAVWPAAEPPLVLHSAASDRHVYLQRPDLGRRLDERSRALLAARGAEASSPCDLALVVADGLCALGIGQHAAPLLAALRAELAQEPWLVAPLVIVEQGRVAIGDEIGELLGAKMVALLIGERPGLSSPDSMGLYLTWAPRVGLTDERRNCISNIRPAGLNMLDAARKLHYLLREGFRRGLTGVELKDEMEDDVKALDGDGARAFLL
ncbi:ethanolamine ammonia-lyase subunit EutC [Massilia sp. Leaf139]|uniref:ethanolamine ammonia-lyase subunit EutC n=1 Tax=Massilia sp. Leaf139 TaxID=1736272 RepID=UPI0006F23878|nr:ethanolamine ammonia-lyase subunit EutC [Massilia sp. Leaf139]KQQ97168.1 ethanolamine ammonia-lyase [Massilia sp. Leaf139]